MRSCKNHRLHEPVCSGGWSHLLLGSSFRLCSVCLPLPSYERHFCGGLLRPGPGTPAILSGVARRPRGCCWAASTWVNWDGCGNCI
jgi:hypothetical protein